MVFHFQLKCIKCIERVEIRQTLVSSLPDAVIVSPGLRRQTPERVGLKSGAFAFKLTKSWSNLMEICFNKRDDH